MSLVIIDPAGDLFVKIPVPGDPSTVQKYRVCKRAMQRLYDAKNELFSGPGTDTAEIPTAHPVGIVTIAFKIAHAFFKAAPDAMDEMDLFYLLKFTNELSITHILRPYAKTWAAAIKLSEVGDEGVSSERLYIAWELGDRASFDTMVTHVACISKKRRGYDFREYLKNLECFQHINHIHHQPNASIVDTLVEDIVAIRVDAIQVIYHMISDTMKFLATDNDNTPEGRRLCRHRDSQDLCAIVLAGSLYQLLFDRKLCSENRPKPDRQARSVLELIELIRDVQVDLNDQDLRHFLPNLRHPKCGKWLPLFTSLEGTMKEFSVLSLRHFDGYFKGQGRLTGFVVEDSVLIID